MEVHTQPISKTTRLTSMVLDHMLLSVGTIILCVPLLIYGFMQLLTISHEPHQFLIPPGAEYAFAIGIAVYFGKDSLFGRSPAKHILKLQVVHQLTGEPAGPMRCFVRNIFCVIWPIEVIAVWLHPERRIGDLVAGTKVVQYTASDSPAKLHWPKLIMVAILGFGCAALVLMPFQQLASKLEIGKITLDESAYNPVASELMQTLFADSLGLIMLTDIRVYDAYKNEQVKYVSIIAYLEYQIYVKDPAVYAQVQNLCVSLVNTVYPPDQVVMRFQFVSNTAGTRKIDTRVIDERKPNPN